MFVNILDGIGYDGFTNIEADGGKTPRDYEKGNLSDVWNCENLYGFSGIGIINENAVIQKAQYFGWEEIKIIPEVDYARAEVFDFIKKQIYLNPKKSKTEIFKEIWGRIRVNQLVTEQEVWDTFDIYDKNEIQEQVYKLQEYWISKRRDWGDNRSRKELKEGAEQYARMVLRDFY